MLIGISPARRWSPSHNLTVTDRPDLPHDPWLVWMIDNTEALEAIAAARMARRMDDEPSEDGVRVRIDEVLD